MNKGNQGSLFGEIEANRPRPLAHKLRPMRFTEFQGIEPLSSKYPFLKGNYLPSIILHGPSGCGKTTLARILAKEQNREFLSFNAVLGGVNDLRKLISEALHFMAPVIFIDEIHRFNKAQQDALLPQVESGDFVLIGATTENPKTSINRALLSRCQLVEIPPLSHQDILSIQSKALEKLQLNLSNEVQEVIALASNNDARKCLNILETLAAEENEITEESIKERFLSNSRLYDKSSDRHYDVISAFIKSMRGSDPDNALLWLAVMLDGGEDPMFIARRLVIFASEDIGNADPRAITLATSAMEAISKIGMPEARIILGQITSYCASTVKSNCAYKAIDAALEYVRSHNNIEVPTHLRNQHPDKMNYKYPHNFEGCFTQQVYGPASSFEFYDPSDSGQEKFLKERLNTLWK